MLALAVILALFSIIVGLGSRLNDDFSGMGESVYWPATALLSGAFVLAGLRYGTWAPVVSGMLLVVRALFMRFAMWRTIVVPFMALVGAPFGVVACRFAVERPAAS